MSCKMATLPLICLCEGADPFLWDYSTSYSIEILSNLGRGVSLRLIRNTEECGGLEEMRPIDQNLQYDFNFQQFTVLPNEVTVLPVSASWWLKIAA